MSSLSKKLTPSKSSGKLDMTSPKSAESVKVNDPATITDAEVDSISQELTDAVLKGALAQAEAAAATAAAESILRDVAAAKDKEASVLKDWQQAELQRKASAAASLTGGMLPTALLLALLALAVFAAQEAGARDFFAPPPPPPPEPSYFMSLLGLS